MVRVNALSREHSNVPNNNSSSQRKTAEMLSNIFECSQYRYAIREWKRYETARKSLEKKPVTLPIILFKFSILCMLLNLASAGLLMMQQSPTMAFKCCCGALAWAACIFIFDQVIKHEK